MAAVPLHPGRQAFREPALIRWSYQRTPLAPAPCLQPRCTLRTQGGLRGWHLTREAGDVVEHEVGVGRVHEQHRGDRQHANQGAPAGADGGRGGGLARRVVAPVGSSGSLKRGRRLCNLRTLCDGPAASRGAWLERECSAAQSFFLHTRQQPVEHHAPPCVAPTPQCLPGLVHHVHDEVHQDQEPHAAGGGGRGRCAVSAAGPEPCDQGTAAAPFKSGCPELRPQALAVACCRPNSQEVQEEDPPAGVLQGRPGAGVRRAGRDSMRWGLTRLGGSCRPVGSCCSSEPRGASVRTAPLLRHSLLAGQSWSNSICKSVGEQQGPPGVLEQVVAVHGAQVAGAAAAVAGDGAAQRGAPAGLRRGEWGSAGRMSWKKGAVARGSAGGACVSLGEDG